MAFINDQVAVLSYLIIYDPFSNHALNHGHIQLAIGFLATASDSTNLLSWNVQE